MSGLIFKGDVISSTGEYLPAPYINKITVSANASKDDGNRSIYQLEIYIFVDDYEFINVFESGNISDSKNAYKSFLQGLNYYVLALSGLGESVYQEIIKDRLNPLKFYNDFESGKYQEAYAALIKIETFEGEPQEIYDESGNRILIYSTNIDSAQLDSVFKFENVEVGNIEYIMSFCSIFDYYQDSEELFDEDYSFFTLDIQTGDVSYEKMYVSSDSDELALQDTVKFYDSQNISYDKIPLASIERNIYKVNLITHDDIKKSIDDLLNEYSDQYNSEVGFENLKREMNSIYSTLEEFGSEYDIVPRLDDIRKNFSDKTPIKMVGKLYKRYSRRLFEINKSITQADSLNNKITYNSKLIDHREIILPDEATPSFDDSEAFIYSDTALFTNLGIQEQENTIVAGYFFFDYEKAIRKNCSLANHLDINKLENLGLNLSYSKFSINNVSLKYDVAEANPTEIKANFISSKLENISLEAEEFPYVKSIEYNNNDSNLIPAGYLGESGNDIDTSIFYGYESPSSLSEAALAGYATSVINRPYASYPANEFSIDNYRLMLFEVLEYRNDYNNIDYQVSIEIEDTTLSQMKTIFDIFEEFYNLYVEYTTLAIEACAFNNDSNKFNKYFIQALVEEYGQDEQAVWYTFPSIYSLYADLLYNIHSGDMETIEEEAKKISSAINPYTGDITSINFFKESADKLYESLKEIHELAANSEETVSLTITDTINIEQPQDKIYSGLSNTEIEVVENKRIAVVIDENNMSNIGQYSVYDLYQEKLKNISDIRKITSVLFSPEELDDRYDITPENNTSDTIYSNYNIILYTDLGSPNNSLLYSFDLQEEDFFLYSSGLCLVQRLWYLIFH